MTDAVLSRVLRVTQIDQQMPLHPGKDYLKVWGMNVEMKTPRETDEDKESDTVDGQNGESMISQQKAADKYKFYSVGYQKNKLKVRTVATYGKESPKPRGPQIQDLFCDRQDKTPMQEDRCSASRGLSPMEVLKHTLQSFAAPDKFNWWSKEDEDKADILEKSWTDIVLSHKSMPKTQRHQQEAIWELVQTEFVYINKLATITDLVLAALQHVHQRGFLHEVPVLHYGKLMIKYFCRQAGNTGIGFCVGVQRQPSVTPAKLFSNISFILDAHKLFWWEVLYPMLQNVRLTGQPFDPLKLEPGCLQFADRFSAYLDYCWKEERNVDFTRRQQEVNPYFCIFLKWVETHPQCGRMRLNDMQAKPHQRITKYPLLLKAILKATQDPCAQQTLNHMINSVSQFLDSINDYLVFKDDELALFALSQKIEGYDLQGMSEEIEKYMQEFCRFDLTTPIRGVGPNVIRKLIMGETLKVRGRKDSKLEVAVLLFTDVLLLTKTQKKSEKQKVVRPPLSLDRIHCAELKDGYSFVLVEVSDLGCPVSVYSVSTPSPDSCSAWVTTIHQAQEVLQTLRKTESVETEEPSDQDSDQFPPAGMLNGTGEKFKCQSHLAPLRFTTIRLEREDENGHNQRGRTRFPGKPIEDGDTQLSRGHGTTRETERRDRGTNGFCENGDVFNSPAVERRVTWNHKGESQNDSSAFPQPDLTETNEPAGPHRLLVGGLREIQFTPLESAAGVTQQRSQRSDLRQESRPQRSGDENESCVFTRILNSPRLRRKRPMNSQPSAAPQGPSGISADAVSSRSVSDSEGVQGVRRSSNTSVKSQDHLVLKMSSVKQNTGAFWNIPYERSSESDSELPKETENLNFLKVPKIKPERSESMHELQSSPLQGILNRAKERERERGMAKREGRHLGMGSFQSSNSDRITVTTRPPSLGGAGKESAAEERGFGARWFGSDAGTETSALSSKNDRTNRTVTPLSVNVDWPGWCFDDEAVLEFTGLGDETSDWFEQILTRAEPRKTPRHSDADFSEV